MNKPPLPSLDSFPLRVRDTIRYGDMDRQGHVNNAVFSTFFETGRVGFVYGALESVLPGEASFVLARIIIDFHAELRWPGEVDIGTRLLKIGRSSLNLAQAIFKGETCVATSECVLVMVDKTTRRSMPFPPFFADKIQSAAG
jgi:acyl-CoA thioester hydrolase